MYLEKINSPSDIKSYSLDEMKEPCKGNENGSP